jgi:peptide-methionine (R)-S-oxide reductase
MKRRDWLKRTARALGLLAAPPLVTPALGATRLQQPAAPDNHVTKLVKPKAAWRELVSREAYEVLFEEDTERPFTSPLNDEKRSGLYICAACFLPLFDSKAKFDSGTGWPSFYEPIKARLETKRDYKLILPRTEYHCVRCGGHQGHVFNDGPRPTGQRWCNNGVALRFVAEKEPLPDLRT